MGRKGGTEVGAHLREKWLEGGGKARKGRVGPRAAGRKEDSFPGPEPSASGRDCEEGSRGRHTKPLMDG
jgi:hypothetical protein